MSQESKKHTGVKIFLTYFFLAISLSPIAQNFQIKGKVTAVENDQGLFGVTIRSENSQVGTITDADGNYTLLLSEQDSILTFSSIGFITQKIFVRSKKIINVSLELNINQLDEVIVIGYGTQSKRKLTSSISILDTDELKKMPVPTVSNGLEGLAAGLFVRQTSGEPGFSSSSFEIRNFGNALVIVDGSPGSLDELDPNEIKNITVLKDAAASAVYGVQGGNGVILVETRRGLQGKPILTYNNQYTFSSFTSYPEMLNSPQYATVRNEGLINSGESPSYTDEEIELFKNGLDPINYPNEDWRDLIFRNTAFQQRHNLNLNGGNENIRYFVSLDFWIKIPCIHLMYLVTSSSTSEPMLKLV